VVVCCVPTLACTTFGSPTDGEPGANVEELSPEQEALLPSPDMIGVVERSILERVPDSAPVYFVGTLQLRDGRTVIIDESTERVRGCDGVKVDQPEDSGYVYDYSDCLALVDLNAVGSATTIQLVEPSRAGLPAGWTLLGTLVAMGETRLVLDSMPGNGGFSLPFTHSAAEDIHESLVSVRSTCGGGMDPIGIVLMLDSDGAVTSLVGYARSIHDLYFDGPYPGPCDYPNPNI
jgi:hypothetical protein